MSSQLYLHVNLAENAFRDNLGTRVQGTAKIQIFCHKFQKISQADCYAKKVKMQRFGKKLKTFSNSSEIWIV